MDVKVLGAVVRKSYYVVVCELPDGTPVNEVTRITGPGLGADTELEAPRPLTTEEAEAIANNASSVNDVARLPTLCHRDRYPVQLRY